MDVAAPTADAVAVAQAAHDIARLVRGAPERLLWVPGRPLWGLALVRGTDRIVLALDGCLAIAATVWPSRYRAGAIYPLDAVARALAGMLALKRLDGALLFVVHLPDAVSGTCCAIITHDDAPWLATDLAILPLAEPASWLAPADPSAAPAPFALHPWQTLDGLRAPEPSLASYLLAIGEPPEQATLPPSWRRERLLAHWRLHLAHERGRLELCGRPLPAWLADEPALAALVERWLAGWRGDLTPAPATQPVAEAGAAP